MFQESFFLQTPYSDRNKLKVFATVKLEPGPSSARFTTLVCTAVRIHIFVHEVMQNEIFCCHREDFEAV